MSNSTVFILLLLFTVFIPSGSSGADSNTFVIDTMAASGYVAFIVNSQPKEEKDNNSGPNPDVKKCSCKGTGKITHGDGHKTECPYHGDSGSLPPEPTDQTSEPLATKCQCDSTANGTVCNCIAVNGKCYCEKYSYKKKAKTAPASPSLPVKSKQILYFTADWCGPCQSFKSRIPILKEAGYTCSTSEDADIRIVDVDTDPDGLYAKYGDRSAIPAFFLIKNGKRVSKIVGLGDVGNQRPVDQISNMWNEN